MGDSKHTPGPWMACEKLIGKLGTADERWEHYVANSDGHGLSVDQVVDERNALVQENGRLGTALVRLVTCTDAIVRQWNEKWVEVVKGDMRPDYRDFFNALEAAREAGKEACERKSSGELFQGIDTDPPCACYDG